MLSVAAPGPMDAEDVRGGDALVLHGQRGNEAMMASRELLAQGRQFFPDAQEHVVALDCCRSRFGGGTCNGLVVVFYASSDVLNRTTALGMMCKACERWTPDLTDQVLPGET